MKQPTAVDILLVEDNPRDAELTIRAFTRHNLANQLFVVEDGAEALDFLFCRGKYIDRKASQPKLVLLDMKLPKVDGLEVLRSIKENERTSMIPVVMVTTSSDDPEIKAAYELGANSYVIKPVEFDSFMEAMTQIGLYWLIVNRMTTAKE